MTPEEVEAILQSNAKAIASNSNAIAESRRETNALYNICSELARNTSELARDRAVMYEILRGLNEDRVTTLENLSGIAENVANLSRTNVEINNVLERIANALENQNR
ncbi:hypothetical protein [Myxosarcina sp. GI1(2024)]